MHFNRYLYNVLKTIFQIYCFMETELEEAKEDSHLQPSENVWLCQHLDFELSASTSMRQ